MDQDHQQTRRTIYENISHSLVLIIGMTLAVFFYDKLDRILAFSGTILGTMVVLFVPSVCHYRLIARDKFEGSRCAKVGDLFIACYALGVLLLCSVNLISNWDNK